MKLNFLTIVVILTILTSSCGSSSSGGGGGETSGSVKDSYDCSLIKDDLAASTTPTTKVSDASLQAFFNSPKKLLKCGVLPASLVNNHLYNAKFLIKWDFRTTSSKSSIQVDFQLDSVEDYSSLKYYFNLRRFDGEEYNLGVKDFYVTPVDKRTNESSTQANNSSGTGGGHHVFSSRNSLIFNANFILAKHHNNEFDEVRNAYVVCVVVLNSRLGVPFNLPFMCVDIFIDKFYYEKDKMDSIADIIYTLVPLAVLMFLVIVIFYKPVHDEPAEHGDGDDNVEGDEKNRPSFSTLPDSVSLDNHIVDSHYSLHRRSLISTESNEAANKKALTLAAMVKNQRRFSEPPKLAATANTMWHGVNEVEQARRQDYDEVVVVNPSKLSRNPEMTNQSMAHVKKNSLVAAEVAATRRRSAAGDKATFEKKSHDKPNSKFESTAEFYI